MQTVIVQAGLVARSRRQHAAPTLPQALRRGGWLLAMAALIGAGCGSSRTAAPPAALRPADLSGKSQRGLASYYANSLAGRRTASGERYQPAAMTAAHRRLPFGTWLRVLRLDREGRPTGPSVVVRVNDRGPFSGRRILDLSWAAARALGMIREGVVPVQIDVIDGPPAS